jgi:hypothetical protein
MGLNDLLDKKAKENRTKSTKGQKAQEADTEDKVSKSIRMRESTYLFLKKVTNRLEEESGRYTHEDAILEGLTLLAKERGITAE